MAVGHNIFFQSAIEQTMTIYAEKQQEALWWFLINIERDFQLLKE